MQEDESTTQTPETELDEERQDVVRVEANIEEMPIFSATKRSRRDEIVVWKRTGRDPATGRPIEQEMMIRPAQGLGLPGQVERDLYYLVISPWVEENGFGSDGTIGPISYSEALLRLGWTKTGPNYTKIREALETLVSLNFKFTNCIMNGETRQLEAYIYGHLFEQVEGYEEKDLTTKKVRRGDFLIMAAKWFVSNHKHAYLKPLDLGVYRQLRSPIAQSLYNYLDKRAYSARRKHYEREVVEDIFVLRERFRLGVQRTRDLVKEFKRAHEDLLKHWSVLQNAEIRKVRAGHYQCVYTFDIQYELPLGAGKPVSAPKPQEKGEGSPLTEELVKRGVSPEIATKLVGQYAEDRIRRQVDVHDQELKQQGSAITNPGGRLRKRIEEDWAAFRGYQTPEDRGLAAQKAAEKRKKALEEQDRVENWWKYESPEERARDYVAKVFRTSWAVKHGNQGQPSPEEEQKAYEDTLARYRNQAEEGRARRTP